MSITVSKHHSVRDLLFRGQRVNTIHFSVLDLIGPTENIYLQEREFVLAGTGHMSCHSQQKFMIPNKPREKLPKEKPTLFETYHAKPPSQYRHVSNK